MTAAVRGGKGLGACPVQSLSHSSRIPGSLGRHGCLTADLAGAVTQPGMLNVE